MASSVSYRPEVSLMSRESVHQVWKSIAMFLAGAVLSLLVMWGTYVRSAVSREEMENYVNQRLSSLDHQIADLNKNVIDLKETTAGLKAVISAGKGKP